MNYVDLMPHDVRTQARQPTRVKRVPYGQTSDGYTGFFELRDERLFPRKEIHDVMRKPRTVRVTRVHREESFCATRTKSFDQRKHAQRPARFV
jgi:hypothetical protein